MDKISFQLNESQLKIYRQAFYNFEKYIEDIYSKDNLYKKHKGYLINLKDFKYLEKIIDYDNYKKYNKKKT